MARGILGGQRSEREYGGGMRVIELGYKGEQTGWAA